MLLFVSLQPLSHQRPSETNWPSVLAGSVDVSPCLRNELGPGGQPSRDESNNFFLQGSPRRSFIIICFNYCTMCFILTSSALRLSSVRLYTVHEVPDLE